MLVLSDGYHALITDIHQHRSQTTDPYTKALLEQMVTVKKQMADVVGEMGCLSVHEEEDDFLCLAMVMEEKRLEAEIVTEALRWYDFEKEKDDKAKADAEMGQEGGWVFAKMAEVEDAGP